MRALDTNVIIRFLVKDDIEQAEKVLSLFKKAEREKEEFFVPLVVVLEMIWVLESVYKVKRDKIIEAITDLLYLPVLEFENRSAIKSFLWGAKVSSMELSDLLIASVAKDKGCEKVISFDKRAAKADKSGSFQLL